MLSRVRSILLKSRHQLRPYRSPYWRHFGNHVIRSFPTQMYLKVFLRMGQMYLNEVFCVVEHCQLQLRQTVVHGTRWNSLALAGTDNCDPEATKTTPSSP